MDRNQITRLMAAAFAACFMLVLASIATEAAGVTATCVHWETNETYSTGACVWDNECDHPSERIRVCGSEGQWGACGTCPSGGD